MKKLALKIWLFMLYMGTIPVHGDWKQDLLNGTRSTLQGCGNHAGKISLAVAALTSIAALYAFPYEKAKEELRISIKDAENKLHQSKSSFCEEIYNAHRRINAGNPPSPETIVDTMLPIAQSIQEARQLKPLLDRIHTNFHFCYPAFIVAASGLAGYSMHRLLSTLKLVGSKL